MKLMFLGTGAGVPSRNRNVSALALKLLDELNEVWLFDCGEATQHQILETTLKPRKITKIFITHLHGDHIFGLPGLLSSRSFQGGDSPLTLYGPAGIRDYVESALKYSKSRLLYELNIVELSPRGGTLEVGKGWKVEYASLNHGVLSFGYRVMQPDRVGELLVEQLAAYQIPNGPIYGQLKRGEIVTLEDGTVLDGRDFLAPDVKGKIVTILGDTKPTPAIQSLAKGADVLVHECTFEAEEAKMAHAYHHSTSVQAATAALEAGVKQLYLNHISARYLGREAKQLEAQAQQVFERTQLVHDFDEFEVE